MNNVTLRRKQLYRTISTESFYTDSSLEETCSDNINCQSLDMSTNDNEEREMKTELLQLRAKLACTRNELEKIVLENDQLKDTVTRLNQQIKTLKEMCATPVKSQRLELLSARKKHRRSLTDNLRESMDYNNSIHIDKRNEEPNHDNELTLHSKSATVQQESNTKSSSSERYNKNNSSTKNMYVIGGAQCKGLNYNLTAERTQSKREPYQIMSFIKPGACTENIIRSCKSFNISKEDCVVLSIGEHDTNPVQIMTELSAALKTLYCPVFVLGIGFSKHLNENKLNEMLKLICRNFVNCRFIDICNNCLYNNCHYHDSQKTYLYNLAKVINVTIDQLNYDRKYLYYNNTARKQEAVNKNNKQMRGYRNMPLYRGVNNKNNKNCSNSENMYNTILPKKGTIPYYFKKLSIKGTNIGILPSKTEPNVAVVNINADQYFFREGN